jgi:hypothetical protein
MIHERRRPHGRRRGEENGRPCWLSIAWLLIEILIVLSPMGGSGWIGYDYGQRKGDIVLKEVPKSEYKGVRR